MECAVCGELFYAPPSQKKRGARYCSVQCKATDQTKTKISNCECRQCGKRFFRPVCHLNRSERKFCSRKCRREFARNVRTRRCKQCDKEFSARNSQMKFCSHRCYTKRNSGQGNWNWKGGRKMAVCEACGRTYTHGAGEAGFVCSLQCWGKVRHKHTKGSPHPTGKGGRRADLGNIYFRSRWEANWARYLNWLKQQGKIASWEYEADTFEFVGIKRGCRFYTPDFKVTNMDQSIEYHEVKGWMDSRSKTRQKRMTKYHPTVKVVLVDGPQIKKVASVVSEIIPNWERDPKKHRHM